MKSVVFFFVTMKSVVDRESFFDSNDK